MEGKRCSRISTKTLDSATSPQSQKGNVLEAEGSADSAREETPALPSGNRLPAPLQCLPGQNVLEDTGTLKMNIIMQMGLYFAADSFPRIIP